MRPHGFTFGILFALLLAATAAVAQTTQKASPGRERLSLDRDWLFHDGDVDFPVISGQHLSYNNAKSGVAWGAAAPDYDDSEWKAVALPHDWAVEQPFDPKANLSQGYRARGIGWYRKYFRLDAADRGRHLELQLDGIATHATVWVNGVLAERNWCGYTSMYVDITPFARFDEVNTIAVRVDAVAQEGWWYEGAGIYRHTWLVKREPVHIATDGVYANPVRDDKREWAVPVEVTLESSDKTDAYVIVEAALFDPNGAHHVTGHAGVTVKPLTSTTVTIRLPVLEPKLWSVDHPTLYTVRTRVQRGDWPVTSDSVSLISLPVQAKDDQYTVDQFTTRVGFRTIRFDADKGFFLNDQPLKLKGTCNHQDMAGVGVAVPDSIWDFRVRRLKEMGSNAYRAAHNAPAAEFLDACDRLGLLVMDENRNFGSLPEYIKQLQWLVRRDRNHPSVILWSVFNEEPSQGTEMGYEMVRRMSAAVKTLDTTRPVTAAQSAATLAPVNASQAADVTGFNYRHGEFDAYHERNPTKPATSSEDTSCVMTRGEYTTDKKAGRLAAYDNEVVSWGLSHRNGWKAVATRPWMAGQFVWTGFDYRGEPQPLEWPSTGSSFGIMDLCGFPKTAYYIHQAQWIEDRPVLAIAPHWNWPGREGQPVKVMVMTNADTVSLWLNGKPMGEHKVDKYDMLTVDVPYAPGKLEAVATRDGKEVIRTAVETTGSPAGLKLLPDRKAINGDGWDAMPVTVQVVDAENRVVPTAGPKVKFELVGPAAIIGLNNGDTACHEPEKGDTHSLFNGLGQVIVQTTAGGSGPLKLRATADGLAAGEVTITVNPAAAPPAVQSAAPTQIVSGWRLSPTATTRPDPNQQIGETDMNTWSAVRPGRTLPRFNDGKFAVYRATFRPRGPVVKAGGRLTLRNVTGRAEVFLNGKLAAEKKDAGRANIELPLPPGLDEATVSVLIEADGDHAGLGGAAVVE